MTRSDTPLALVADIGGTNTRCALARGTAVLQDAICRYSNSDFKSLDAVLRQYRSDQGDVDPDAACVAVAGPVFDGTATMTNLDWTIDRAALAGATGAEHVAILNDLQAQGHALGHLDAAALRPILTAQDAATNPMAARLVVGVGTGFNVAPVWETAGGRFVPPSESGHTTLPVRSADDLRLAPAVADADGMAAVEDVLSGRGLERLYSFFANEGGHPGEKAAKDIMDACEAGSDPYAAKAVARFVGYLGTVCGDHALIHLPFGGIYLVGGVARAMVPYLATYGFAGAFCDKGRFADFMTRFPVSVIEDDYAALAGCAAHVAGMQTA
ncbi:glucokinase [Thalassorhabdomicrobium marinisediminis]|uniref:glucokinase n=1 Tax=Thalassorhabdomicrobium marinisediminis TaxID=2170577 RepID=UPI00249089C7|nr:glucokinase [Thalassorhabdomicrobium marinisediminis]